MAGWIDLIGRAQLIANTGDPTEASRVLRAGLNEHKHDNAATAWLTFNLMLSESQARGPEAAREFASRILPSSVSWSAKLYTLELALASLPTATAEDSEIYDLAVTAIGDWCAATEFPDDINLISCQSLVRHVRRAYAGRSLSPLFDLDLRDNDFPVYYRWGGNDTPPLAEINCNRMPRALRTTRDTYESPQRPLGFRYVGRAFILRLGDNTLIFDGTGRLCDTPYGPLPAFVRQRFERAFASLKPKIRLNGTSLFVGDFFSQTPNYCHWMLDSLPRILAARAAGLDFDRVVCAMPVTASFQVESLTACLKSQESFFAPAVADGLIEIDDLYFADNGSIERLYHPAYGCDPELLGALRATLNTPAGNASSGRRLYVPRRHSRVVTNESELISLLQHYRFEVIDTDAMSTRQQIDTFADASAVIGPHGAALTNLLFCPPGTCVLELFPAFGGSASFYRLAPALGQGYSCYIDDLTHGIARDEVEALPNNNTSIYVDVDFVRSWLDKLS